MKRSIREGIRAVLTLGLIFSPAALQAQPNEPPNVVIFLADDLGWNDVGYHGSVIQTPNLDRLAREGAELDRFYVYPVCSPTRAGLMTARSSMRTGIMYSVVRPWANHGLAPDEHLMPQSFQAGGYQTFAVGKWHLGHTYQQHLPQARGFDHFYGHVNGMIDYYTHRREGAVDWQRNGTTVHEEGYTTELFAREAVDLIKNRDKAKPFFLYLPFNAPHTPLQAPDELMEKYAHIEDERRRVFAAMVEAMDTGIGEVLDALEQEGVGDKTIVLFFSDNGGPVQQGGRNDPLRDGKASTYEGGIRVPAIIRWTGKLEGGRSVSQVITNLDVFPTLAAAAGVKPGNQKPLDGKNLWPEIVTGRVEPREDLFFAVEVNHEIRLAVLHKDWKLVQIIEKDNMRVSNRLFNLEKDPGEQEDVSAEHSDLVRDLAARLQQWRELHPRGGIRESGPPHPGWIRPKDWAAAVLE